MIIKYIKKDEPFEKVEFQQFLDGNIANDYIFQRESFEKQIEKAAEQIETSSVILIGAGAGMSTAAGLEYGGKRFTENFAEFIEKYGKTYMRDMYSSGFYPFPSEEEKWGYWSKHALLNRVQPEAFPLYKTLFQLVKGKKHFILTTNVDHQFWKAGFKEESIFATQGDYGEIQCAKGCHPKVYDALGLFKEMNLARKDCAIPRNLVPKCPHCGGDMAMHLRSDAHFVEDRSWNEAAGRYRDFLQEHKSDKILLLELGVGFNTPIIIRLPFEKMMRENKDYSLIRLNKDEAVVPESLGQRAIGIGEDIGKSISALERILLKKEGGQS